VAAWTRAFPLGLLLLLSQVAPAAALSAVPEVLRFVGHGGGEITIVGIVEGLPPGGILLSGDFDSPDWSVLFFVTRDASASGDPDSLTQFTVTSGPDLFASPRNAPTAAGWIPGLGVDLASANLTSPPGWRLQLSEPLRPGEQSDLAFASFARLPVGDLLVFSVPECEGHICQALVVTATLVPEPATAASIALGLAVLAYWQAAVRRPPRRSG
jgi:hypothetical protein